MDNESVRNIVMLELVAPSHECFGETFPSGMDKAPEDPNKRLISEEESKELYRRFIDQQHKPDWNYVFGAIKDEDFREKMINLYKELK